MTAIELARLVAEMRRLQRDYFRLRTASALEAAREAERRVDRVIREVLTQPTLFGGEDADDARQS